MSCKGILHRPVYLVTAMLFQPQTNIVRVAARQLNIGFRIRPESHGGKWGRFLANGSQVSRVGICCHGDIIYVC